MLNEELYSFEELDATGKENAKALIQNQNFYLTLIAEMLNHDFVEPVIKDALSPQFDDFFDYNIGATARGLVRFSSLLISAVRKEDINFLLEFILDKDFRRSRHSIKSIIVVYKRKEEEIAYPSKPTVRVDMDEPLRGRNNIYTRDDLEKIISAWVPAFEELISIKTINYIEFLMTTQEWFLGYINTMDFRFTKDGKHIII